MTSSMYTDLTQGFDTDLFCQWLRRKFDSFAMNRAPVRNVADSGYTGAERLGIVRTLAGPGGLNKPMPVVAVAMPEGATLSERSNRIRQFKFARWFIENELAHPSPGVEGILAQGLFVFYDDDGNFRLSLVFVKAEGTKLVWSSAKRWSFTFPIRTNQLIENHLLSCPLFRGNSTTGLPRCQLSLTKRTTEHGK